MSLTTPVALKCIYCISCRQYIAVPSAAVSSYPEPKKPNILALEFHNFTESLKNKFIQLELVMPF